MCEASGHVSLSTEGHTARVAFQGEIDLAMVDDVDRCVGAALAQPGVDALVVDLAACTYLDSSGLRALLRAHRETQRAELPLSITGVQGIVRRVIELTHLDGELPLAD
jgi:anti-anti-sigma factor